MKSISIIPKFIVLIIFLVSVKFSYAQCIPTGMVDFNNFNIVNVQVIGDGASQISNFSGADNATYSDFTGQSVTLTAGGTYTATISHVKETWGNLKVVAWIDYQGDGSYVEVYNSGGYVNNNNGTATTNISFTLDNTALPGTAVLRISASYCDNCGGGASISSDSCTYTGRAEIEDYTINVNQVSAIPIVSDDDLEVLIDSTPGVNNQINVATNDYIGTTGGDGEDYSLLTGAANGVVTEISDGIFEYIPNSGFNGVDSFTYNLCNVIGQCEIGTVNVNVGFGVCEPVSSSNGVRFITNVTLPGETVTIDNDSGDEGGYQNFTNVPAADVYLGGTYDLSILIEGNTALNAGNHRSGWVGYIDFNKDGIFDDGERIYRSGGAAGGEESNAVFPFVSRSFVVPTTATTGLTVMRVGVRQYWSPGDSCGTTGEVEDFEDYALNISLDPFSPQDITVVGNNTEITNGQTDTSYSSFTDFGVYDVNGGAKTRVFKIYNNGASSLVLGVTPVVLQAGSSADFSILTQPVGGTSIAPGGFETFSINFDPSTIVNNISAVVVIDSNDPDENPFTYNIVGEGDELYPDTDGDGVSDNVDVDDDNDGIEDGVEQLQCLMYSGASIVETTFLIEDFGAGVTRSAINGNTDGVTTSYCYEDGLAGQGAEECDADHNLNDGEYVVHYSITNGDATNNTVTANGENIAEFANYAWYKGDDHTPGDTNGRMAVFNAATDPGVFYETAVSGILPNVPINYSFWAINIDNADNRFSGGELPRILPNITVKFLTSDYATELASFDTGDITRCASGNNCVDSLWKEYGTSVAISESEFVIQFINNAPGGNGNDLAIDDIIITQSLCDLDNDGVADIFDLDNDNDGIPNIYEYGAFPQGGDVDKDGLVSSGAAWLDANGNGMHDAFEGGVGLDTDGDGSPDYIDLDSDNDSIFDVVENNGNGDLDVDGDGLGDGGDADTGTINDDFDGDGVLALIDGNDNDSDGDDHGLGVNGYEFPLDTDGDGVPDYLDVDSNDAANDVSNGSDISNTIYFQLDGDNDGIIDGGTDADSDGIIDAFDSDNSVYGSPRDLENSYSLFFDGRNDYVEDATVLPNGNATLMAWIKSEGDNAINTNRIVAGQTNFYLVVNSADNTVSVVLNGSVVLTSTDVVVNGVWAHITATTNGSGTVLYINGQAQGSPAGSGGMSNDTSNFTIGRLANNDSNYFHGEIDEVRVFNISLTEEEVQRTVYQELDENQNFNQGKIIPKDISGNSIGANLVRYYKMDGYKGDITDNKVTPGIDQITGAKLYNIKNIYFQTAPLPYKTIQDGPWTTVANWEHGDVWDIDVVANNKDWSIVQIDNNISTVASHTNLGLVVKDAQTFTVTNDNYINNTWYLEINGTIDLLEDSQIIQTTQSDLVTDNDGNIFRRQEGLANKYRYNYWGSPVGKTQATSISDNNLSTNTSNSAFNLSLLKDNVFTPMEFTTSYDELGKISTYWTYIYQSGVSYYSWVNIGAAYDVPSGFGYIHKGTGVGTTDFQYIFDGKPNNGIIIVSATDTGGAGSVGGTSRTTSLLGNPYPSALGVGAFINDNSAVIGGELYLWEQWGGDSHVLNQYQGGYATVNLTAGIRAYQFVGLNGDTTGGIAGVKTPESYLSVGQGFIVEVLNDGDIEFNNSQRVFKKEALGESVFFRQSQVENQMASITDENPIKKIRLQLTTANDLGREIVMGFNSATNDDFDYGFDAKAYETFPNDLTMTLDNNPMVIQSYADITADKVVALNFEADGSGMYSIQAIEFVDFPTDQEVFLRDNLNNIYYDLTSDQAYSFASEAGVFADRFDVVFQSAETLSTDGFEADIENVSVFYIDTQELLFVKGLNVTVKGLKLYNTLGQQVYSSASVTNQQLENGLNLTNLSTGLYVVSITMENNQTLEKKIILK
ncbi:LamG-like jellyroll fold domain-containing protein [Olleya sp. HaHaR_3_96]|uniref:LamG-like jellyroll fold domain-containing protein n=1 Tax=Olleya sp. HaHaR_3_96 TaxID=2745560 RepID=UPI001C5006E6|nr:LamG-like jellyroll fold domain-containing protein [Olleya sp. HaHaR_3_96]QXP60387.1 T9SS type A sorting domain-containing protein [Olleya sp. HaHaR_3_96]